MTKTESSTMTEIFDTASYEKLISGYTIYDCAINNQSRYCFLLVEQKDGRNPLPRTRFVIVLADKPMSERFGWFETGSLGFSSIARGIAPAEYVAVDTGCQVYSSNAQRKGMERSVDEIINTSTAQGKTGIIQRVVRAAGQVYALGDYRKIYRRIDMERWIELNEEGCGVPMPKDVESKNYSFNDIGFRGLSAFAKDNMYAVGGKGNVWHFNGTKWTQCPFPSNAVLETVACGDDGNVYISDAQGSVWKGQKNTWSQIAEGRANWGFQPIDSAWFKGRLYLGSQDGLYVIGPHKDLMPLQDSTQDSPAMGNCGRLDVSPDGQFLLTAGSFGASLYDGKVWKKLFSSYDYME